MIFKKFITFRIHLVIMIISMLTKKTNFSSCKTIKSLTIGVLCLLFYVTSWSQNSFNSGDGWGSGWGTGSSFSSSAGSSLIYSTTNSLGSTNRYFRFYGTGTPCGEFGPSGGLDVLLTPNTPYTNTTITCGSTKAFYLSVSNTTDNWIFKSATSTAAKIIIFRVQGVVQSISSTSRNFTTVLPGLSPTITANLNGNLSTGQGVYLRYSTDNFLTSTVVAMSGSGSTYTANIPVQTANTTVRYYTFTSGNGLTISHADADWYTINLENNSGSNYSYTVSSGANQYRSKVSGNWNASGTWEVGNGTEWANASTSPTSTDGTIVVQNSHNVTVSAAVTVDELIVNSGGTLTVASAQTMTLANGTGTDLLVNGTVDNVGTINFTGATTTVNGTLRNAGTCTGAASTTLSFSSTGTYEHNFTTTTGTIPTATWSSGSTCAIVGYTSTAVTINSSFGQSFSNFTWNCTSQSVAINLLGILTTVNGNFVLQSAGTGSITYNSNSPTTPILTIGGNCTINASINLNNGTSTPTFNIGGNFSHTGGTISRAGSGVTTFNFNKSSGTQTFSQSGGTITATANWNVGTGTSTNTLQLASNVNLGTGTGTFTVLGNATFDAGTNVLSGSAASTINSGGSVITANTGGVNGSITLSGTRTYNAAANYTFNGSAAQVTGAALATANNVTINNSAGVTLSTNTAVTGTLTFTNGNLTTNGNTLSLSNSPSGATASRYIIADATGTVTMNSVSTAKTLPIGTATAYAPLTVTAGSATNYTATVSSTLPCSATEATRVVNLAWTLNGSNAPSNVVFQWPASSQAGSFNPASSCDLGRYNTSCPYNVSTIGTPSGTGPYTLTASSGFASGNQQYVIGNADAVYLNPPTIAITVAPSSITHNTASSGGQTITGNSITAKGVVWDTVTSPTVALSTKTNDGTGTADFSSSLTSLAAQTLYYIRAYASNAGGTGYGNEITFRTLSAPVTVQATGLSATATSSSNIDLSWTGATFPSTGATASGFILLRAISPNTPSLASTNGAAPSAGANTTIVSSVIANNATSFSNSGLASATVYNYLLIPYTWDGTNATTYNYLTASAPTANATTQSGATPPVLTTSAASSVTATSTTLNGEITADGGGSVTARGFVYSSSDTTPTLGEGGVTDQASGSGTGVFNTSVSGLSGNTTYYYQAYATNSSGTSYGGIITFTTPKAEPTAQPTALVFSSVTTTSFNTAFTAASGSPDGYLVLRSTSASLSANPADGTTYTVGNSLGGGTVVSVGTTISGIVNSSLTPGTTYYTFVFAFNNSGATIDYLTASPLSSSVITISDAPSTPSFSSITTTGATVSWSAVTGADSYRLDISSVSNFASFVSGYNDLTVSGTSQALTGLTPNTTYFARIRAVNASGTSSSSPNGSSATLHNAPTVGAGSGATTSAITANWTAPTGGGGVTFTYTVELSTNAVDFSSPVATQSNIVSGTLSFQFTGLTQGTVYYYRVKAVNATGSSDWSSVSAGYSTLASTMSLSVLGTAVTENFNGMGTSATASTPTGIRIGTDFNTGTTATTLTYGNTGTGVVTSTSSGGAINWADGIAGSATDRALGFLSTGSYTSPRSIVAAFKNNTGSTITNLTIDWKYEKYRSGTRAFDWTFLHGASSTPTTAATDGNQSYAADANNTVVFSPSSDVSKSVVLSGLSIADGATYYLMWTYTGLAGSSNSQGLSIDDLSIKGCGDVAAPTASNQTFCSAVNATIASLTATGTAIKWYAASSGGTALSTSTALVNNTIYYASQTIDGCESVNRTAVTVTITTNPTAPTGTATQILCTGSTVANLTANGTAIQWYAASTGGTPLSTSTALVNNTIYYASQTVSGCESTTRFAVTASLVTNGTWLGTTSTDWNTASNWCGGVPTSSTNVVINSGASNYPDLSTGADGVANSITINSGGSLTIGGTETLTITAGGSFTNNGTFTAGSSTTVIFAGTGSIVGTATFNNITTSGTLTPSATTTINGTLSLNSGGSIATNSPIFGSASTLQYNFGGGFGSRRNQALEWPSSNGPANLSITNGSWIQITGNRSLSGNANITNGALQASGARTLTMNGTSQTITVSTTSGGAIYGTDNGFGNDLSLVIANGSTTTLTGDATSSGDDEKKFLNVTVNAGGTLTLSRGILCKYGTFTVNGTLRINSNGYVQSTNGIAPTYGASATLIYNTGGSYGRGLEWSTTSGAGYPTNVQISNATTFDLGNGGTSTARQCSGTLTVDTGSTLTMNGNAMSQALTIKGKFTNNGTTILSSISGGDLKLEGDMDDNGTFTANGRAIFFEGGNNQTINSTTNPLDIDVMRIGKSGGEVILAQNLLVDETNDPIQFTTANSVLNLNGYTATFGKAGAASAITMNGSSRIKGSTTSSLEILGTGAFGTLYFDQTSLGSSNALNNFTINRTSSGSLTLANPIAVSGTLTITNGTLNLGTNRHTANALTLGSTAQTTSSSYGGTGSPAENINTTYFAATSGYVNVGSCTAYSLTATSASACLGSPATVTLTNTTAAQLPVGTYTVFYTLTGSNTGSASSTMVVSTAGTGTFSTTNITANGSTTVTINFIRNGCVSAISSNNSATVTINAVQPASVSIASSDADNTICAGTSVTFTATPTNGGTTPSYQWRVNGNNVGTNSATYTTSALVDGDAVTVVMTSNASPCLTGSPATSSSITTTVVSSPTASILSNNGANQCPGSTVSFTLSGTANATVSYTINGGATQTTTLTGGTATITIPAASNSQTLNLESVDNGVCLVSLSDTSTITIESTTWNGTAWSNGTPTSSKAAIIAGNMTISSNLEACSLTVNNNAVVTVSSGYNVTLQNALTVASGSSFTVNSNANLIQVNPAAVNSGNIVVKRISNPLMRLDYILWGSPVVGQNLFNFSSLTSVNPTIRFYSYNSATNSYNSVSDYTTHSMNAGKGYLIRLPFNHPTAPASWTGTFTGVPNNGTYTIALANNGAGFRYNAVSNPYPSTLSMAQFYADNINRIEPTLYYWRKTNSTANPSYCSYNLFTDTYTDNGQPYTENPNGVIQVGQGFFVEAKNTSTSVVFNNGQRIGNNANQMFRNGTPSAQTIEKHRIWLNLTGTAGEFSQAMVGYFTGGTLGADDTDAKFFNDGTAVLNSKINGAEYIMNGRPVPFDTSDIVPMNLKVTTAGTYTIAIDHKDGLFADTTQDIFLKDNETATYHNLNNGPYTFTAQAGVFENRFEIVYQNALGTIDQTLEDSAFAVVKSKGKVSVKANTTLQTVSIYDIHGRLITQVTNVNAQEVTLPVQVADQVILVQVTTTDKKTGVKKAL